LSIWSTRSPSASTVPSWSARVDSSNGLLDQEGSAYIFSRNQGGTNQWGQVKKLVEPDPEDYDDFGVSVAVDGGTVVVGASLHSPGGATSAGAAYVFSANQGGTNQWGMVKELSAADGAAFDFYGFSVSLSGGVIAVGAYDHNNGLGAAYLYGINQGGTKQWGALAELNAGSEEIFGIAVNLQGTTLAVTSSTVETEGSAYLGTVHLYTQTSGQPTQWPESARLTAADGAVNDSFGSALGLDAANGVLVVGAPFHTVGSNTNQGCAYVFTRNSGGTWTQTAQLIATSGARDDDLGSSAATVSGQWLTGAPGSTINNHYAQGAVYAFGGS